MSLLDHALSEKTLELIERVIELTDYRLVIYGLHNWALEHLHHVAAFAFDPQEDSAYLQDQLRTILQHGQPK